MRKLQFRYYQLLVVGLVLMGLLVVRLFVVTVFEHQSWTSYADNLSQKKVYTSAPRGEIKDRYGRVLAGNIQSFSVYFDPTGLNDEEINSIALNTIEILERNGDTITDDFPIIINEDGTMSYTYDVEVANWLESEGMPTNLTAEQAFDYLRNLLGIDPELDVYEAQAEMQDTYGVYPPISVKTMAFTQEQSKQTFLSKFQLSKSRQTGMCLLMKHSKLSEKSTR